MRVRHRRRRRCRGGLSSGRSGGEEEREENKRLIRPGKRYRENPTRRGEKYRRRKCFTHDRCSYQFTRVLSPYTASENEIILFTAPFYGDKLSAVLAHSSVYARPRSFYVHSGLGVMYTRARRGLVGLQARDDQLLLLDNDVKCFSLSPSPPSFILSGHYYPCYYYYYYCCVCLCVKLRMRSVFPHRRRWSTHPFSIIIPAGPRTPLPLYYPFRHSSHRTLFAAFIPVTKHIIITLIQFVAISCRVVVGGGGEQTATDVYERCF